MFACISLVTFLIVLDYSIANVSIPYIAGDLAASTDQGIYVITAFAIGSSIGLAMTGFLTKRIGEIRLITAAVALFTLFSLICGLSSSLEMLVIARFIQGLVSGPLIPLSQSLLVKYGTLESRARDLAIWSMIVVTAPVIGPILGGYISDWYSWQWIFYINIPVGIFCSIVIWRLLGKRESPIEKVPIDVPGIIFLSIGVSTLQVFLDKGQQWDWWRSNSICCLITISILSFICLLIRELYHKTPLLDVQLFKIPSFTLSIFCLMISYAMYFGSVVIVPLWLQEYMDYNAEWAGLAVCTLGVAPVLFSLVTPVLIQKLGTIGTLMISFFFFAVGCFYSAFFTTQVDFWHIAFGRFIFGCGFICYIAPLLTLNIQDIPSANLTGATGIFHFLRAVMGAVGTSVFSTIWERRTIFHHLRIGENLTLFNPQVPEPLTPASLEVLNRSLDVQAAMLAINDTFLLMGGLFIGLIAILAIWKLSNRNSDKPSVSVISVE